MLVPNIKQNSIYIHIKFERKTIQNNKVYLSVTGIERT